MFSRLREPFGKAGLIVAIVALLAATVGGAYAANKQRNHKKGQAGLNAKQKKQVKNIAKAQAKSYANSNPGPAGPQGPAGNDGQNGANGSNGSNGEDGEDGESVTVEAYAGPECAGASGEAGAKFSNESGDVYACNGGEGTFDPNGFTQTGVITAVVAAEGSSPYIPGETTQLFPISFTVPLTSAPEFVAVKGTEDKSASGCPGLVEGVPQADPGKLCVYLVPGLPSFAVKVEPTVRNPTTGGATIGAASKVGAILSLKCTTAGNCPAGHGVWAVTG